MKDTIQGLIEFEHVYVANSITETNNKVKGHRTFSKNGKFIGLYDRQNNTVWSVNTETLMRLK